MKKRSGFLFLPVLPVFLFFASCEKNSNAGPSSGCLTQYQPVLSKKMISAVQFDSVSRFFSANGLSTDSLQPLFFAYSGTDSLGHGAYYQVPVRKLVNGLPVADANLRYDFFNGKLVYSEKSGYDYPVDENDTTPKLSLNELRTIFLASNPDSYSYFGIMAPTPHPTHWADSCIYATLQYSDRFNYDCCNQNGAHGLIRTWSIQYLPDTRPLAVIIDDSGKIYPTILIF